MTTLTIGSLFTGYGGLDQAVQQIFNAELAWVSDNQPGPKRVLAHHHPDIPNLGDITKINWHTVQPVNIICGGSPCQDLSTAGTRQGLKTGTRSGLWHHMKEAIHVIKPEIVIWENVPGARSAPADSNMEPCPRCLGKTTPQPPLRALGRILGDLASCGYDAEWTSIRASDIGACHRRERIFLYAYRP